MNATLERLETARAVASLVSVELLADCNWQQACEYERDGDKLVFPATDDRPYVEIKLPLALIPSPSALREVVSNALASYHARLPG